MPLRKRVPRFWRGVAASLITVFGIALHAQIPARVAQRVSDTEFRTLPNTAAPFARTQSDTGRLPGSAPMRRILLMLTPSSDQEASLKRLLNSQNDPASPDYQRWLTPEQYGERFGPADADVQQVSLWLVQNGFQVDQIAAGRQWLEFSGTASQVESAFHTEMHQYRVNGRQYTGNATDISLPQALAPVVGGVVSLSNYEKQPMQSGATLVSLGNSGSLAPLGSFKVGPSGSVSVDPTYTLISPGGTYHFLSPGDFQNIYNIAPLLKDGTGGTGVSVAIVGRTDIRLSDVQVFRQIFGLPPNDPQVITNGADPGYTGDELEAHLDVQWAGAAAPHATIDYVASATTAATDGVDLSAAYIIDHRIAPIMSTSYGLCEALLGPAGNAFYEALWRQAAAEGMTVFVSSGDSGAAGCDPTSGFSPAQHGRMVNGLASTPYNVAVGGTEFNENGNDAAYWATQNNPDQSSAFGYIPEMAWNESCDPTQDPKKCGNSEYRLVAGGGGPSNCAYATSGDPSQITCSGGYEKPSWQAGPSVPDDGVRDLPDVSLAAASGHDGYLVCIEGECQSTTANGQTVLTNAVVVGGTSASSPAMAGMMALVEQQRGTFLGLVNYNLYQLAAAQQSAQCDASILTSPLQPNNCVFNDITTGNNSVPGVIGFDAAAGYDMATGLGSVNAANLVTQWPTAKKLETQTTLRALTRKTQHGQPITLSGRVRADHWSGVPSGDVALDAGKYRYASGSIPLTAGAFSAVVSDLPGGKYALRAHYNGDAMFSGSDSDVVAMEIMPEPSTVSVQPYNLNLVEYWVPTQGGVFYGTSISLAITVKGLSGMGAATGTVTVLDGGATLETAPIAGGSAWVPLDPLLSASLEVGTHNFSVQYSGDNSFNASATAQPVAVTIIKAFPNFVRIIGDVTNLPVGTPEQLHLVVLAPGTAVPSGTVQVFDNDVAITAPITLDATVPKGAYQAAYTGSFGPGTHSLRVSYSGDSRYNAVAVPSFRTPQFTVSVAAVTGAPAQVQLAQASSSIVVGQSQTYAVTVVPAASGGATPGGTVSLIGQFGYIAAAPVTLVNGRATLTVPWSGYLGAGANQLVAQYSGDSTYAPNISAEMWTIVLPATPAITLSAEASLLSPRTTSRLTVDVLPTLTDPKLTLPYGLVQFYDSVNGAPPLALGLAQSLQAGNGNYTTFILATTLPRGTNVITAQYLGSPNGQWGALTAIPVTVLVTKGGVANLSGTQGPY